MSLKRKLKIGVLGATGFTGLDLVLLLSKHPKVEIINFEKLNKKNILR